MFLPNIFQKKKKNYKKLHEFITEEENQLAYKIAHQLILEPDTNYNPITLFGPSGCGKTHLLEAIAQGIVGKFSDYPIMFLTGEEFHHYYLSAVRHNQRNPFRYRVRNCRAFILDDLHKLQKKPQTQKELLFTINELLGKDCLIIFSSQIKLKGLSSFNVALVNRLESGLFLKLVPLSAQTASLYLQKIANQLSFAVPQKALQKAIEECPTSFGEFRKQFRKLLMFCAKNKQRLSENLLTSYMSRYCLDQEILSKERILKTVAAHYRLTQWQQLTEKGGARSLKEARYIAIALTKDLLEFSNQQLQDEFGNRSESSLRHAVRQVFQDQDLQKVYLQIKEQLKGR